ncbi:hypothetical protein XNC3_180049 [Xenorhabdus nematophila F1]|nr:hypothetical protein XNC3_180049 [Xenorhabdus nematophila F1]
MIRFDLAINQIAKIGLSSLQVIYYFEILFKISTIECRKRYKYILIRC